MSSIGFVIIGRNEGQRFVRCLNSVKDQVSAPDRIVYVDSGSTDGSPEFASSAGVSVISLDLSQPFTMARGRNVGLEYLLNQYPNLEYIQFIDGDCELVSGWIEQAVQAIEADSNIAIVCGRRRERFPEATIYNQLIDMEWNTPIGTAAFCGGDALIRTNALQKVNGYRSDLICGEEPEMCIRLRHLGWTIQRIDADMTLHDAAVSLFSQWWKRSVRYGWSVAEGKLLHGNPPEKYMIKESFSGWFWGLVLPFIVVGAFVKAPELGLLLMSFYIVSAIRIYQYRYQIGDGIFHSLLYSVFCIVSKFPQVIGQIKYQLNRWEGKQAKIIEYKIVT